MENLMDPLSKLKTVFSGGFNKEAIPWEFPHNETPSPMNPNETSIDPGYNLPDWNSHAKTMSQMPPEVQHAMQDKLLELINNMPERNKPGIGRKIFAGLAGLSRDPNVVNDVLYGPYKRQMNDFNTKFDVLSKGAELEYKNNAASYDRFNKDRKFEDTLDDNARLRQSMFMRDATANRRIDVTENKNEGDLALKQKKLELDQKLAAGGTIWVNKQDGKVYINHKDGRLEETKLDGLSEQELEDYKTQGKLKEIRAAGNIREGIAAADRAAAKERNDADNAQSDKNNIRNNETRLATSGHNAKVVGAMKPAEKKTYILNRATEWIRAHPEFKDYFKIENGNVLPSPPKEGWTGPNAAQIAATYEEGRKYIDPDYTGSTATSSGTEGNVNVIPPKTEEPKVEEPKKQSAFGPRKLPAPTADAALMNDAISEIDKENALRAKDPTRGPQIPKIKENIDNIMAQLKARKGGK